MVTFASELVLPYDIDSASPFLSDPANRIVTLQIDDGTTVLNALTGATGETFDLANQVGIDSVDGIRVSATWTVSKPSGADDDPFSMFEVDLFIEPEYCLSLPTASESLSIPFVGAYDIDLLEDDDTSTNYTGTGTFVLDGTTAINIKEIKGTDTNGFHYMDFDRETFDNTNEVPSVTSSLVTTVTAGTLEPITPTDSYTVIPAGGGDYLTTDAGVEAQEDAGADIIKELVLTGRDTTAVSSGPDNQITRIVIRGNTEWTDQTQEPVDGIVNSATAINLGGNPTGVDQFATGYPIVLKDLHLESTGGKVIEGQHWRKVSNFELHRCNLKSPSNHNIGITHSSTAKDMFVAYDCKFDSGYSVVVHPKESIIKLFNCIVHGGYTSTSSYNRLLVQTATTVNEFVSENLVIEHEYTTGSFKKLLYLQGGAGSTAIISGVVTNVPNAQIKAISSNVTVSEDVIYPDIDFSSAYETGGDYQTTFYQTNLEGQGWNGSDITEWNHEGAITPVDKVIDLVPFSPTTSVYQPTIIQDKKIDLGSLINTPIIYNPTVAKVGAINFDRIESTAVVYDPEVFKFVDIDLPVWTTSTIVYSPTLVKDKAITLDFFGGSTVYQPTITKDQDVTLDRIESTTTVYSPTVLQDKVITLGETVSTTRVFLPIVTGGAQPPQQDSISARIQIQWDDFDRL